MIHLLLIELILNQREEKRLMDDCRAPWIQSLAEETRKSLRTPGSRPSPAESVTFSAQFSPQIALQGAALEATPPWHSWIPPSSTSFMNGSFRCMKRIRWNSRASRRESRNENREERSRRLFQEDRHDNRFSSELHYLRDREVRFQDHSGGSPHPVTGKIVGSTVVVERDRYDYSQYQPNRCKYQPPDPFYEPSKTNDENVVACPKKRSRRNSWMSIHTNQIPTYSFFYD